MQKMKKFLMIYFATIALATISHAGKMMHNFAYKESMSLKTDGNNLGEIFSAKTLQKAINETGII